MLKLKEVKKSIEVVGRNIYNNRREVIVILFMISLTLTFYLGYKWISRG